MGKFAKILLAVFGWAGIAFAFLGLMVSLAQGMDGMDVSMIIFFAVIGAGLIYASKKVKIADSDTGSAQVKNVPPVPAGNPGETAKPESAGSKQIVCASCGARTHVGAGPEAKCEYCGSPVTKG